MRTGFKGLVVTVGVLLLMSAPKAYGAMSWELLMQVGTDFIDVTSNGITTTCTSSAGLAGTSCGAGLSSVSGVGPVLNYNGAIDSYNINIQTATSYPGLSLPKIMDLASTLNGSGTQLITVKYAVTGFTQPPVGPTVIIASTSFDPGATVKAYQDPLNGNTVGSTTPAGTQFASITNSVLSGGSVAVTGTYSLTELLTFQGTFLSSDVHLDAVPEPASVTLLGGLLLVTASMLRRRQKRA